MDEKLLEKLKKLPKKRYRELTEALGDAADAKTIKEGLNKEGVEITDEEAAYLVSVIKQEAEMELTEEQLEMIAGGKGSSGCV